MQMKCSAECRTWAASAALGAESVALRSRRHLETPRACEPRPASTLPPRPAAQCGRGGAGWRPRAARWRAARALPVSARETSAEAQALRNEYLYIGPKRRSDGATRRVVHHTWINAGSIVDRRKFR